MGKVKHIIVTRLAIKWRFNETNLSWEEWTKNSLNLMNEICRPSLKNQTDQDFTLLSLVDEELNDYGDVLENEKILKIKSENNQYPKKEIIQRINKYVSKLKGYDSIILTRLDRDDALRFDFIEKVKNYLLRSPNRYIDLNNSYTFDYEKKIVHKSKKYFNTFVSPFVSVHEKIENNKIKCISLLVDHNEVPRHIPGKKVNDLYAMQVIHGLNLVNRIYGSVVIINKEEYGFKK